MAKANKQRGAVTIEGPGGEEFTLCLTLGAIAQIEEEIEGIESLSEIDTVMNKARMKDVVTIFVALLNGGGHDVGRKDMMRWDVPLPDLMTGVREAFAAAGFNADGEEDDEKGEGKDSGN